MVFRVTGGATVIANKVQRGGWLQNIACQWRGSLKYYKALERETQG